MNTHDKSIIILAPNGGDHFNIYYRPYVAHTSPSPGQINDCPSVTPRFILDFPDSNDKRLLSWLAFSPSFNKTSITSTKDLPIDLIEPYFKSNRLYSRTAKKASWKRVSNTKQFQSLLFADTSFQETEQPTIIVEQVDNVFYAIFGGTQHNIQRPANPTPNQLSNIKNYFESKNGMWKLKPHKQIAEAVTGLKHQSWKIYSPTRKKVKLVSSISIALQEKENWFELNDKIHLDDYTYDLATLLGKVKENSALIEIEGEESILFSSNSIEQIKALSEITNNDLTVPFEFASAIPAQCSSSPKLTNISTLLSAQMAEMKVGLHNAQLRSYQRKALNWVHTAFSSNLGAILADEMGLGKTIIALALITQLSGPTLIVCPASVISQWLDESQKFIPQTPRYEWPERDNKGIVILSYQKMLQNWKELKLVKWDAVIFDEAHYIKNPKSKTYIAAKRISTNKTLLLTGTPIENSMRDLWALLQISTQNTFGDYKQFTKRLNKLSASSLNKLIAPYVMKRTRKEVLPDLPQIFIQDKICDMTNSQKDIYQEFLNAIKRSVSPNSNTDLKKGVILESLLRLRQICCDPLLLYPNEDHTSGKTEAILNDILSLSKHSKVLVFSQFSKYLRHLSKELSKKEIIHRIYDGATPHKERESNLNSFKVTKEINVMLMALKAGGVGLNITEASYVLIADPWWNHSAEMQAYSRCYRMGQTKNVHVIRYFCNDSVEEKVLNLQKIKSEVAAIVPGDLTAVLLNKLIS